MSDTGERSSATLASLLAPAGPALHILVMSEPFRGSEAVATGGLSKSALRSRYRRLFPDIYLNRESDLTPVVLAKAGWLWSGRQSVVAGPYAAALHGAGWVSTDEPVDLLYGNRSTPAGIKAHGDRISAENEIVAIEGVSVTSPLRTALDIGCWYPIALAVPILDALSAATQFDPLEAQALLDLHPGRRGIRNARRALPMIDAGAQSPREAWLRLLLIAGGLPRPQTQIPVRDDSGRIVAYLDMGWEDLMVAVEYDGEQHRTDRRQYTWDVRRLELLKRLGWIVIRVVVGDRREDILERVRAAIARRASLQRGARHSA
jgi:hypothetical protein